MSELTRCNYCSLQRYRREAQGTGKHIQVVNVGGFLPYEVYKLPKGVRILGKPTPKQRKAFLISCMMDISGSCVC